MIKSHKKLLGRTRRGAQPFLHKTTMQSHVRVISEHTETRIIIEGDDAKTFIQRREMQIMRISRMTSTEEHKVASERERLKEGYKSVQKYFRKK